MEFILKHKSIDVAELTLDDFLNITSINTIFNLEHLPVGTVHKGIVDKTILQRWLHGRSIPASRSGIDEVLHLLNLSATEQLIAKCFGLSLSDQYWLCPQDSALCWDDINFFQNEFSGDVGNLLFGAKVSGSINLVSPDNTSDGQLIKKWTIVDGVRKLIKGSSAPYYQEALNEKLASQISTLLGINHIDYDVLWQDGKPLSICDDFITENTELISASYIMQSVKNPNDVSELEHYLNICTAHGIKDARDQLEKMLILDYIIANEDRHFNNFGVVRDADTLEWLGIAPIFDCGTSLWYNTVEMMIPSVTVASKPFKNTHEEQINLVRNLGIVDLSKLNNIDEIAHETLNSSYITDERQQIIIDNLTRRINALQS